MPAKPVILDHDGGHDDFVALALLLANPEKVKVIGCVVTDADCYVDYAFQVCGKLMSMLHCTENTDLFPIGRCSFKGINPFPSDWRWSATNVNDLPCINIPEHLALWETLEKDNRKFIGEQLMADLVMNSKEKVTICVTGPLSCVAWCIKKYGKKFTDNVEQCIIMGGAVDVKGNVFVNGKNGTAEWNIYWDPTSAKTVLEQPSFDTILFPLDATNHVPVNSAVVQPFGKTNKYLLSQFVGSVWSACTHVELMRPGDGYYAWDVLTAAYAINQEIATLQPVDLEVITDTGSESEGRTSRTSKNSLGHLKMAINTSAEKFYAMCYEGVKLGVQ